MGKSVNEVPQEPDYCIGIRESKLCGMTFGKIYYLLVVGIGQFTKTVTLHVPSKLLLSFEVNY